MVEENRDLPAVPDSAEIEPRESDQGYEIGRRRVLQLVRLAAEAGSLRVDPRLLQLLRKSSPSLKPTDNPETLTNDASGDVINRSNGELISSEEKLMREQRLLDSIFGDKTDKALPELQEEMGPFSEEERDRLKNSRSKGDSTQQELRFYSLDEALEPVGRALRLQQEGRVPKRKIARKGHKRSAYLSNSDEYVVDIVEEINRDPVYVALNQAYRQAKSEAEKDHLVAQMLTRVTEINFP